MSREDWPEMAPSGALYEETERKPWRTGYRPLTSVVRHPDNYNGRCARCKQGIVGVEQVYVRRIYRLPDGSSRLVGDPHVYHPECWKKYQMWYAQHKKSVPYAVVDWKKRTRARSEEKPQPSTYDGQFWLVARRQEDDYPDDIGDGGKWMVFVPVTKVDSVWATIKQAVEEGRLGDSAKVATARENPNAVDPNLRVICVYTYDGYDKEDVMRVREVLRDLGVAQPISYKLNSATLAGKYAARGSRVSLYRV